MKVDFTSLYPATSKSIEFDMSDGEVHTPLSRWYTGFPDPTVHPDGSGGWKTEDFGGIEMTYVHWELLIHMHCIVCIRFDQAEMTATCCHHHPQEWQGEMP